VRRWTCDRCGVTFDRNVNPACNILLTGQRQLVLEKTATAASSGPLRTAGRKTGPRVSAARMSDKACGTVRRTRTRTRSSKRACAASAASRWPAGAMAHHGYERPCHGSQTLSCMRIRFKPLEVSSEDLVCILSSEKNRLEAFEKSWSNRGNVIRLQNLRDRKAPDLTPTDVRSPRALISYIVNLKSQRRYAASSVTELQDRLDAWVQTEFDALVSVCELRGQRP